MSQSTFDVTVHTDGACSGNPGPGGWAAVLSAGDHRKEVAGHKPHTTNNEMELMAVLEALKTLKRTGLSVAIYTDSQLVVGWLSGEYRAREPHIAQLVAQIKTVVEGKYLALDLFRVKAHSGNAGNERANRLAQAAAAQAKAQLLAADHSSLEQLHDALKSL
jgi:ribonuclease HI